MQKEREDIQFSIQNLGKRNAREWDLNDPDAKKNADAIRVDAIDENGKVIPQTTLGVSSGQVFHGEDLEQQ